MYNLKLGCEIFFPFKQINPSRKQQRKISKVQIQPATKYPATVPTQTNYLQIPYG